jgi:hypothetical protein
MCRGLEIFGRSEIYQPDFTRAHPTLFASSFSHAPHTPTPDMYSILPQEASVEFRSLQIWRELWTI